jgi:IclR family pca regulon transcriptional regulator
MVARALPRHPLPIGQGLWFHEVETGFHSIAVPLRRWDGIQIAALNVGSNIERPPADDMLKRILPALQATARKLQSQLV